MDIEPIEPKESFLDKIKKLKLAYPLGAAVLLIALFISYSAGQKNPGETIYPKETNIPSDSKPAETTEAFALLPAEEQVKQAANIKTFASKEEFIKYLENAQSSQGMGYGIGGGMRANELTAPMAQSLSDNKSMSLDSAASQPERYSQTNVQVSGIDEPDIIKTDGQNLFMSLERPYYYYNRAMPMDQGVSIEPSMPSSDLKIMPPYNPPAQETEILKAFPVSELKKIGRIDKQGNLLLVDGTLIIFTYQGIYGYDVKTPSEPKELWYLKYENNSALVSARLLDNKIYFVTQNYINYSDPCPILPLSKEGKMVEISCPAIYHPIAPVSDSITYTAFSINPKTGEVQNKLSFLGSYSSTVYMSKDNLYVSYMVQPDTLALMVDFLKTHGTGLFPSTIIDRLNKLQTYDISSSAKLTEMSQILEKYYHSLNQDERLKKENELANKMSDYIKENQRKLVSTGIVKISLNNLSLEKTGSIPGTLLNQFSLDEYQGNLRVATTIGGNGFWWGWGFGSNSAESVNDVYILNKDLSAMGSVKDLGKTERIYSARFIEDKGYLVTFRQTDPFYVLDLKDPKNPKMAGELKIPGFSSYLHPLEKNKILGVGQENGQVKLSLFDVSNPNDPKEIDKYLIKEYWSEAANNHHAFLQDDRHKIFFLPAGQNGYIFSYKDSKLSLTKAVSSTSIKRAIFINDFLYIISDDKVIVLNETTWEKVKELSF